MAASLDEHGYALVEGLLPPEDVAAKLAALDGLFATTPTGNAFEGFHTQRIRGVRQDPPSTTSPCTRCCSEP